MRFHTRCPSSSISSQSQNDKPSTTLKLSTLSGDSLPAVESIVTFGCAASPWGMCVIRAVRLISLNTKTLCLCIMSPLTNIIIAGWAQSVYLGFSLHTLWILHYQFKCTVLIRGTNVVTLCTSTKPRRELGQLVTQGNMQFECHVFDEFTVMFFNTASLQV